MAVHAGARGRLIAALLIVGQLPVWPARADEGIAVRPPGGPIVAQTVAPSAPSAAGSAIGAPREGPRALPRFSRQPPGGPPEGWQPLRPSRTAPDTRYTLEPDEAGVTVLRADADRSMSGLSVAVDPPSEARGWRLRWRWKVAGPVAGGDPRHRGGDDYAARVYVTFDHPPDQLPLALRARLAVVATATGRRPPSAALNYVWDAAQPPGTILPNPYTDRVRMVVLRSGAAQAGQWFVETRDLAADYLAAFGEPMPPLSGVAVASDADDTGGRATAWFGDLELLPPPR